VHVALAPGESLLPGVARDVDALFEDRGTAAVVLPLAPVERTRVARAAARLMRAWDARYQHDQTFFAVGARVAFRAPPSLRPPPAAPPWTSAAAAPALAFALDAGQRVRALRAPSVATPVADDLHAWLAWARAEGAAWGPLARADPRFARVAPVLSRAAWWRHNVLHAHRRVGEVAQAARRLDPGATFLHVLREAAWTRSAAAAYARG